MFQLKQISKTALPGALAKAERYRLLNEPEEAESICRDVLAVEPNHQAALVTLLLALTDQFRAQGHDGIRDAEATLGQLTDEYQRAYYGGIIRERWARALLGVGDPGHQAFTWLSDLSLGAFNRVVSAYPLLPLAWTPLVCAAIAWTTVR